MKMKYINIEFVSRIDRIGEVRVGVEVVLFVLSCIKVKGKRICECESGVSDNRNKGRYKT